VLPCHLCSTLKWVMKCTHVEASYSYHIFCCVLSIVCITFVFSFAVYFVLLGSRVLVTLCFAIFTVNYLLLYDEYHSVVHVKT